MSITNSSMKIIIYFCCNESVQNFYSLKVIYQCFKKTKNIEMLAINHQLDDNIIINIFKQALINSVV